MAEIEAAKKNGARKESNVQRRIYNCALDLYTEKGFDNVKVSDICKEAGVSVGAFYHYYPSKESVFFGYAEASDDFITERAKALKCDTAADMLKQLILLKTECIAATGPETCNVGWIAELKHHRDVSLDTSRTVYKLFMDTIEKGMRTGEFRQDCNLFSVCDALRYSMGGMVIRWAIQDEEIDIMNEAERIANAFVDMLLLPKNK